MKTPVVGPNSLAMKHANRSIDEIGYLAASINELVIRRRATMAGTSYWTMARIDNPAFRPSNTPPWSKLSKSMRKVFSNSLLRMRPPRKPLSKDEKKQLSLMLGFSTR
jgi:hypothetical protein